MRRSPLRSPPRMRGKGAGDIGVHGGLGITPACTGKSEKQVPFLPPYQDHPRVCGEKARAVDEKAPAGGSPPRVRGKVKQCCGLPGLQGSPPRMRGKANPGNARKPNARITPAYAGKSILRMGMFAPYRDHPRVCGEKSLERFRSGLGLESPPRMRGKGGGLPRPRFGGGITPAYAGKSMQKFWKRLRRWGSPPRVRGKEVGRLRRRFRQGITPACAGKSMMLHHSIPDAAAHDGRQVLRGLHRRLKCDWDGHLRLVQVGNVVHERALMPDVHESQSRRTPQRHNDRMGQPVQAGMHGGSHGCRGRAAAPKCPPPGSERYPFHPLR